jgi:hypothetical protein
MDTTTAVKLNAVTLPTTIEAAFDMGHKAGLLDPHNPASRYDQRNPYDSRTKLGKAWSRGMETGEPRPPQRRWLAVAKLQMSEQDDAQDFKLHPEYPRLHRQYGHLSIEDVTKLRDRMLSGVSEDHNIRDREFDWNGNRRYGPAMAANASREATHEAMMLKLYIETLTEEADINIDPDDDFEDRLVLINRLCEFADEPGITIEELRSKTHKKTNSLDNVSSIQLPPSLLKSINKRHK